MSYPLAVLATCVASANAFMATGPVLRASPAPAVARANRTPLKMEAAAAKPVIGALAEKYSGGFAHPATHADDTEIRKILPHRSASPDPALERACFFAWCVNFGKGKCGRQRALATAQGSCTADLEGDTVCLHAFCSLHRIYVSSFAVSKS